MLTVQDEIEQIGVDGFFIGGVLLIVAVILVFILIEKFYKMTWKDYTYWQKIKFYIETEIERCIFGVALIKNFFKKKYRNGR